MTGARHGSLWTDIRQPVMDDAACQQRPDLPWVPDHFSNSYDAVRLSARNLEEMRSICASCVHLIECRDYAIQNTSIYGIWGGLTSTERREIRAGRRSIHPARR